MNGWTRTLRAVAIAPTVVVSTVAWLMLAALLPAVAGGFVVLSAPTALAMLWLGRSGRVGYLVEQVGVLLAGAREPTRNELEALRPVTARLVELNVDSMRLLISRSTQPHPAVRPSGRDYIVVSPFLVGAVLRRHLLTEHAVALIAHDVGWLRAQPTRGAIAIAAWTLPGRALSVGASRLGTAAHWRLFVGFVWRMRIVIGIVAVIQSAMESRITSAGLVATLLAVTYTTPAARRAHDARLQAAADQYLSDRGLGPALLGAMQRVGSPRPDVARTRRLQAGAVSRADGGSVTEPALRLVRS